MPKKTKVEVFKNSSGLVVARITKQGLVFDLDINECCLVSDKVDRYLFGKAPANRRLRDARSNEDLQPMSKEEMHDLLYSYSYEDGTQFSKAMSVKLIGVIDTGKIKTYGDLLRLYGSIVSKRSVVKN